MNWKPSANRVWLYELTELLQAVPFPANGSQTQTLAGMVGYVNDMREFRPLLHHWLWALMEEGAGLPENEMMYGTVAETRDELDQWLAKRKAEAWK